MVLPVYAGLFAASLIGGVILCQPGIFEGGVAVPVFAGILGVLFLAKIVTLWFGCQFCGLLSYFSMPDLRNVLVSLLSVLLLASGAVILIPVLPESLIPVLVVDFLLSFLGLCLFRLSLRFYRERRNSLISRQPGPAGSKQYRRVAIVGASDAGSAVACDLFARKNALGMLPVAFLDDDPLKQRQRIHGIPVLGNCDDLEMIAQRFGIDQIVIALPDASQRKIRDLVDRARTNGVPTSIVPALSELSTGKVTANRVRPVDIEDLLGREPVRLDDDGIDRMIRDASVLVTGAGGSIGRELCQQIARRGPRRLIMVDNSEGALFQTENLLNAAGLSDRIVALAGNVLDRERMDRILYRYSPELIFHAAAHKHVGMMESQPDEALRNNSFGTRQMADLASEHAVDRFVLISTDKAINPTSAMGASKRLAELYIQAKQCAIGNSTRFMAVRFGNVLGSSNSVVPIFRDQIARGGPVTVTHSEVTRYFMTVREAVGLVMQCAYQGEGGEIFALDMGDPVRIADLARQMVELSGYRPDIDVEIQEIGLRAGEKLYEELQHTTESHEQTGHPSIFRFINHSVPLDRINSWFEEDLADIRFLAADEVKQVIKQMIPEYTPHFSGVSGPCGGAIGGGDASIQERASQAV